ncbi:MAG: two-component regulator propeller domain-containing protein [Vicinamibacterales bacterium]
MRTAIFSIGDGGPLRRAWPGRAVRGVCLSILLAACAVAPVRATDLRSVLTDYTLASWSEKDGLPDGSIYALAQDTDGYLWVGTSQGPYRFDGQRFTPFPVLTTDAGPVRPVRAFLPTGTGGMWLGFGAPGGIALFEGGRVRAYGPADGLPSVAVAALAQDAEGRIWAGTAAGLYRFDGDRWQRWDRDRGVPDGAVGALYRSPAGRFHVAAGRSLVVLDPDGQRFRETAALHEDARAIAEDPFGSLVVTDQLDGFRRVDRSAPALVHAERGRGRAILLDSRNNLWVGTAGQGLWRVQLDAQGKVLFTERATALTGLLADGVLVVMEDREGNIWGATPEGINRLTPHKVAQVTDIGLVAGVEAAGPHALWVGTVDELLRLHTGGRRPELEHFGLGGGRLRALHADRHGTLWVATDRGPSRLQGNRLVPLPAQSGGPLPQAIDTMTSDGDGGIWLFDAERGLLRWRRNRFDRPALPAALQRAGVEATLTDSLGRVWIAFTTGDVALAAGEDFRIFGKAEGLTGGVYQAIVEDAQHVIWLGGTNGLTKYDGRFVTARSDNGFPVANITAIVDDQRGTLWIGSGSGILQIRRDECERLLAQPHYQAQYRILDRADGLAGLPYVYSRNRRAIRSEDGRLWFVTGRGLTVIDPAGLRVIEARHPVRVEGILANGARIPVGPSLELPAGTTRIEVEYTAINLTSPLRQHFRYRLEGFDSEWILAGPRRQAFYTNLPPRDYRFRVTTSDADDDWNGPVAELAFTIQPMFYQTTWFLVVCVGALALVVGVSWRLHLAGVRRQFAMLIGERARLSRELHDTLLQSLVGIALQFDALATDPEFSPNDVQRRELVSMRRRIEGYIREARQSISDLRAPRRGTQDLATALRDAAEREGDGKAVEFTLEQQGSPRAFPAELEDQLLKIGREAIVNAVRHSHGDRIAIQLDSGEDSVTLRVTDNGVGFDPGTPRPDGDAHYGLTSMRERAEELGGQLMIDSASGRGTRVEAVIPLPEASRWKGHAEHAAN